MCIPEPNFKGTVKEGFKRRYTVLNERDYQKYVDEDLKKIYRDNKKNKIKSEGSTK